MSDPFSVSRYLHGHAMLFEKLDQAAIQGGIQMVVDAFQSGRKIITCGNGGSAHNASHYITDWAKMTNLATGKPFRGLSLCDNVGLLTAFGNDVAFEDVFRGQLRMLLDPGDLLVAVSGSGNSPNVLRAAEYANSMGARTLAVVGYDGGQLMRIAQHSVWVPSFDMQLCEDVHLMFGHMVMKALCGSSIR
jgi:D-sedoheptulose 7-phosphate isomerase